MKTRKVYENYGVLAHEKKPVYSVGSPITEVYNELSLALPDGWEWCENAAGETMIESPDGILLPVRGTIVSWGDGIAIVYFDGYKSRHIIIA